jgi:hypothetical protein
LFNIDDDGSLKHQEAQRRLPTTMSTTKKRTYRQISKSGQNRT